MAFTYVPSAKALAFGRDLTAALIQRGFADAVESFSAVTGVEGAPVVTVEDKFLTRIEQTPAVGKDVLGIPQTVYTPHVAKCVVSDDSASLLAEVMLKCVGEVIVRGVRVEVWINATVTEGSISGDPAFVFDSIQYPLTSTM